VQVVAYRLAGATKEKRKENHNNGNKHAKKLRAGGSKPLTSFLREDVDGLFGWLADVGAAAPDAIDGNFGAV